MFRFPRTRFVDSNIISSQLKHAASEMDETYMAMWTEGKERMAEEMIDAVHSLETGLRILQEQHGINVDALAVEVERKNRQRGYYS